MNRLIGVMMVAFLLTAAHATKGGEYYYYDVDGSQIDLQVIDSLVSVRLNPNIGGLSATVFALQQSVLLDTFDFEESQAGFMIYGIQPGVSLDDALATLSADTLVWMANPVGVTSLGDQRTLGNTLLVIYKEAATPTQVAALESSFGLQVSEVIGDTFPQIHVLKFESRTQSDITEMARDYFNSGLCLTVEPDIVSKCYGWSSDPYYGEQWQLKNIGQDGGIPGSDIDWEPAREYRLASFTKPVVALIDAGFQMDHEDLRSNWKVWPYDAAAFDQNLHPDWTDYDPSNECTGVSENCWHGTSVLGVLSACVDNGTGLAGVADSARIMPIKVVDINNKFTQASIGRGLDWAKANHGGTRAEVICITVGFPSLQSPAIDQQLYAMYKGGKPIIAAAGNNSIVHYPASSPYVLAVGMTDNKDDRAPGSGYGPALDVVAPAWDVWTFDLMGNDGLNPAFPALACDGNTNYVCRMSGTSYAAPVVAGIAARLLERNPWLMGDHYKDSAEVMYNILRNACDRQRYGVGDSDYRRVSDLVGWGRVNAQRALASVSHGDPNNDRVVDISDAVYIIARIFSGGPAPVPDQCTGDYNCDGIIDISDAVCIVSYVFSGGAGPCKISQFSICR